MPDLEFYVPEHIATIITPEGVEISGTDAIRAHMEQLIPRERDKVRCVLEGGHKTWWGQLTDSGSSVEGID